MLPGFPTDGGLVLVENGTLCMSAQVTGLVGCQASLVLYRDQVRLRPVGAGLVEAGEVVVVAVAAAQLAVRDEAHRPTAGSARTVADGEPVVQRGGSALRDGRLAGGVAGH